MGIFSSIYRSKRKFKPPVITVIIFIVQILLHETVTCSELNSSILSPFKPTPLKLLLKYSDSENELEPQNAVSVPIKSNSTIFSSPTSLIPSRSTVQRTTSPQIYSYLSLLKNLLNFLIRMLVSKNWTADLASRHLDNLKSSLINYYTKKLKWLEPTPVTTFRDGKGIGFPSLEGALLSLAFLTFSVFLIDLIQTVLAKLRLTPVTAAPVRVGRQLSSSDAILFTPSPLQITTSMSKSGYIDALTTLTARVFSSLEKPF